MTKIYISYILLITAIAVSAQETMKKELPYYEIPEAPSAYTAVTVTARMIDGLGFRYYWATEGLNVEDLKYRPSTEGRSIAETMEHVYGLSVIILNAAKKMPNDRTVAHEQPAGKELRAITLTNFKNASELIKASDDLSQHTMIFKSEKGTSEFPFWNQINGPIEDAVWHTGQIVLMRRSAGNPYNSKANVLLGKVRE
ncbi:MAG: hypothetical protein WBM98_11115 [Maribacter sp.]|uniref:DinB family protein n=1 Tax=Maribacter sp. TaxID=1897614 RepID=UPI003C73B178